MLLAVFCLLMFSSCLLNAKLEERAVSKRDISINFNQPRKAQSRQSDSDWVTQTPLKDKFKLPYHCIGWLGFTKADGTKDWCSGFVAESNRLLVTAAHCVVNEDMSLKTNFRFEINYDMSAGPQPFYVNHINIPAEFNYSQYENNDATHDYAFAVLTENLLDAYCHLDMYPKVVPEGLEIENGTQIYTYGHMTNSSGECPLWVSRTHVDLHPETPTQLHVRYGRMWHGADGGPWMWYHGGGAEREKITHVVIGLHSLTNIHLCEGCEGVYTASPRITEAFWTNMEVTLAKIGELYPPGSEIERMNFQDEFEK